MDIDDLQFQPGPVRDALPEGDATALLGSLPDWHIEAGTTRRLAATFTFDNFIDALAFVNRVGDIAESFDHHPEITLTYGAAAVRWWTHTARGVTVNDFVLARETSRLASSH